MCCIHGCIHIKYDIHILIFYSSSFHQSLNTQLSVVERDLWVHKKVWKFIKRKTVPCGWVGRPPGTADRDECLPGQHSSPQCSGSVPLTTAMRLLCVKSIKRPGVTRYHSRSGEKSHLLCLFFLNLLLKKKYLFDPLLWVRHLCLRVYYRCSHIHYLKQLRELSYDIDIDRANHYYYHSHHNPKYWGSEGSKCLLDIT